MSFGLVWGRVCDDGRLDEPVAARRLSALQGKTRTVLSEGLDLAETKAVTEAARAAVPGPQASVAERLALARYKQSGDQDDAVDLARQILGAVVLAGGDGEDDVAETESGSGITFGPEDVEADPRPEDPPEPSEGFEAHAPDGTTFAVTRADDGSLAFTDPASGEERALPADFVAAVEAATAGDRALRDLVLRSAVEASLVESGGFAGEGTSEAERRAVQHGLRATNQRDKLFHIGRDALPEAHRAAVIESAKRFGIEAADRMTGPLPVTRAQNELRSISAVNTAS